MAGVWQRLVRAVLGPPTISVAQLPASAGPATRARSHDGDKYPGSFGATDVLLMDYPMLRARSAQLFRSNLYARGMLRRLVTNEINTGLHLESTPAERLLGFEDDELAEWSEDIETRFELWAGDAYSCDYQGRRSFGELQAAARGEALVVGDVLCVITQNRASKMPQINLISGTCIENPPSFGIGIAPNGNRICHGVELDADGRHVAFWVRRYRDNSSFAVTYDRVPAVGATGRRIAWLIYGTDHRLDDVRGEPLLALALTSLREIDRYRDSVQRKALINSILAMFVTKAEDKPGTKPFSAGAVRRGVEVVADQGNQPRNFNFADFGPGLILDELQHGEEPKAFSANGTDEKFGDFESTIIAVIAWANEIPPEILMLGFGSNYSASQAAINEFKMYLNRVRGVFGGQFCQPIYVDWLLSSALARKLDARGVLDAWRDPTRRTEFLAWLSADWSGHIKPAVDTSKLVKGYTELIAQGLITRDRASRELTGTKYSQNVKKLARENEQLANANKPIVQLEQPSPVAPLTPDDGGVDDEPIDKEDDDAPKGARVIPIKGDA